MCSLKAPCKAKTPMRHGDSVMTGSGPTAASGQHSNAYIVVCKVDLIFLGAVSSACIRVGVALSALRVEGWITAMANSGRD